MNQMNLPPGVLSKGNSVTTEQTNAIPPAVIGNNRVPYMQPVSYHAEVASNDDESVEPIEWFISMVLYSIPIVNIIYVIIMMIKCENTNKKNWAKAAMAMLCITTVITVIVLVILSKMTIAQLFDSYIQYQNIS